MSNAAPIAFRWNGEAMTPAGPAFARTCDQRFVIGASYRLEEVFDTSQASRGHYFVSLSEAWKNLPEIHAERFPTSESLRKYSLIKCGYADQRQIVCGSKAEAQRFATFIKPMDEYAIVTASECVVTVFTAQSQSNKAMGAKRFQESKQAVLDYVSSLIGTDVTTLRQNAGKAA